MKLLELAIACVAGVISGLSWLAWHKASHWASTVHSGEAAALMLAIAIVTRNGWLFLVGDGRQPKRGQKHV